MYGLTLELSLAQMVMSHIVCTGEILAEEWECGDDDSSVPICSPTFCLLQSKCAQLSGFMYCIV